MSRRIEVIENSTICPRVFECYVNVAEFLHSFKIILITAVFITHWIETPESSALKSILQGKCRTVKRYMWTKFKMNGNCAYVSIMRKQGIMNFICKFLRHILKNNSEYRRKTLDKSVIFYK